MATGMSALMCESTGDSISPRTIKDFVPFLSEQEQSIALFLAQGCGNTRYGIAYTNRFKLFTVK